MKKKVAIVIPWFGEDLKGGAEQLAWQVANRLAKRGHAIEVLTTCCASFLDDWSVNGLASGSEQLGPLMVRRFKVDRRKAHLFANANSFGLAIPPENLKAGVNPFTSGTGEIFVTENINSLAFERFLRKQKDDYHAVIFLPYLYGVILNSVEIVKEKAWLQPCLHDEVYAYLPQVENCMRQCQGILYNSLGEERLAYDLFGPGIVRKGEVVGVGIESLGIPASQLPRNVAGLNLQEEEYILCLGRRDKTKNTHLLVDAYQEYRKKNRKSSLKLIIAGPGDETFGTDVDGIHDLGLVSEEDKEALLAFCKALFQPSRNESYSRVVMEAWFYDRPVAVHGECLATAMAVKAAGGGWLATDAEEWAGIFAALEVMEDRECVSYGKKGNDYARRFADWDAVIDRYEQVLGLGDDEQPLIEHGKGGAAREIHQLLPGFSHGDAISNQALAIREYLRKKGYVSEIIAESLNPEMAHEAFPFQDKKEALDGAALIYHHSIGAGLTDFVIKHSGAKALVYHNVTPPELVRETDPALAAKLEQGIRDLGLLAPHFPVSVGVSRFNNRDLEANGFDSPSVLPIIVSPEKWNIPADPGMMGRLQDGKDNILFVGRLIGNKCQHDLVDAFVAYRAFYGNCRLILVGGFGEEDRYYHALVEKIRVAGVGEDVIFAGLVTDTILHAVYRCAHLFWSMSEHEGFGVPLIESMWFDIPVFAYKSSAVAETLGEGGLLFTDKEDMQKLAITARLLMHDSALRDKILSGQRSRREVFLSESVEPQLDALLRGMNV